MGHVHALQAVSGSSVSGEVRYPRRFEIFRLEALGDDAFFTDAEARNEYERGRRLAVTDAAAPPAWYVDVLHRDRFTVTFYSPHKTPVRKVEWERADGRLFRRRILDLFYPEGDPKRRVPYSHLLTLDQHWYTDGIAHVSRSSPIDEDLVVEVSAPGELQWADIPAFGEWAPLIEASAPPELGRFDLDAIDVAEGFARATIAGGEPMTDAGRWNLPASSSTVLDTVTSLTTFEPAPSLVRVIEREAAKILPIFAQGASPAESGHDPREERRRLDDLAADLAGAFEYAAGRPIAFPLDQRGDGPVAEYALTSTGTTASAESKPASSASSASRSTSGGGSTYNASCLGCWGR